MSDFQKARVYGAEWQLRWFYDHVTTGTLDFDGIRLQLEPEARYGDLSAIQAYVDRVLTMPSVVEEFGPAKMVTVRERKGEGKAHYSRYDLEIAINTSASRWAMRELVVLHEIAHHLTPCGGHGPKFTATFTRLLELVMGPQVALALRIINQQGDVK